MRHEIDYYEMLEVPREAEPSVIVAAFRRLAHQHHPDLNPDPSAHERMRELNEAFEVLSDPGKRAEYDRRRPRPAQGGMPPPPTFTPPTFIPPTVSTIDVWARLRRWPMARLAIAGAVGTTVVMMAAMATQFGPESGAGSQSGQESVVHAGLSLSPDSVRVVGTHPRATPPAEAGETPVDTPPTRRGESDGTSSPTSGPPRAAQSLPTGGASSAAGAVSTPNATSAGGATPTPKPASPAPKTPAPTSAPATPGPPTPTPGQPTVTPAPTPCAAAGTPAWNDSGTHVRFWYGTVVSFQSGPGLLVVNVSGTMLRFLITAGTDVQGVLETALVVSGRGLGSPEIDIDATVIEVVCPE